MGMPWHNSRNQGAINDVFLPRQFKPFLEETGQTLFRGRGSKTWRLLYISKFSWKLIGQWKINLWCYIHFKILQNILSRFCGEISCNYSSHTTTVLIWNDVCFWRSSIYHMRKRAVFFKCLEKKEKVCFLLILSCKNVNYYLHFPILYYVNFLNVLCPTANLLMKP